MTRIHKIKAFTLVLLLYALSGCGLKFDSFFKGSDLASTSKFTNTELNSKSTEEAFAELKIESMRFFRGGWYGLAPGWDTDMRFEFKQDGTVVVESKVVDQFCFTGAEALSKEDSQELKRLYLNLAIRQIDQSEPISIDRGVETLTVQFENKALRTIHLKYLDVSYGDLFAENGIEFSNFLMGIKQSIPIACQ